MELEEEILPKEKSCIAEHAQNNNQLCLNSPTSVEDMDPDTVCGIGNFRPMWLQKYATSRNYTILYSIISMLQGSEFSYFTGIMSTLEKRYAFDTKISGTIMMIDEITPLIFGPILGYLGTKLHRPRIMAIGTLALAVCPLLSVLPYFINGPSKDLVSVKSQNETNQLYCDLDFRTQDKCDEDNLFKTDTTVSLLIIGNFLKGFGSIGVYVIGMTYMDDNIKMKHLPILFAFTHAFKLFGPIIGYVMASEFLKYYEDPLGDPGFGPDDPRWIGAWWIGYVLQFIFLIIFCFPIALFPKRLPSQKKRALSTTQNFDKRGYRQKALGLLNALKRMIKNPFYVIFVAGVLLYSNGQLGLNMLLPKYMEIKFNLQASEASLFSGPPSYFAMQIMIIIGGFVVWKWRPTARKILFTQALVQFTWGFGIIGLLYPSCEHFEMRGTSLTEKGLQIENECNSACFCKTNSYSPVCGPDNESIYFSPCHAGCLSTKPNNESVISNCTCLFNREGNLLKNSSEVTNGPCQTGNCKTQALIYLIIYSLFSSISIFLLVAEILILFRCVEPQDKSLSLGLFEACLSGFALIPHPLIYGALADSACLVWESTCNRTGNCWFYDIDKLSYLLHGVSAAFILSACTCFVILCFMSHRLRNLYEDVNENDAKTEKMQT